MPKKIILPLISLILAIALVAPAAAQVVAHKRLAYSDRSERNILDIFLPEGVDTPPLVMWIHGGGWSAGDKNGPVGYKSFLDAGIGVAAMNYRFCPKWVWPAQLEDLQDAFSFLRAHAADYGFDGSRLAAFGHSAGGQLAAIAGLAFAVDPETRLTASIVYAGPTDFLADANDRAAYAKATGLSNPPAAMASWSEACLIGGPVEDNPDLARRASPLSYLDDLPVGTELPAFLFLHGARDNIVMPLQAARLFYALMERMPNTEIGFMLVPDAAHGGFKIESREQMDRVAAFLKRNFDR